MQELVRFELLRAISKPAGKLLAKELEGKAEGDTMSVYVINEEAQVFLCEIDGAWWIAVVVAKSKI